MNRATPIFEGKSFAIERFDHPENCFHKDPESEQTEQNVVTFIERGAFELIEDRKSWLFSPGDVLVSSPGLMRRYRHFELCPDDICLSVTFEPEVLDDALGKLARNTSPPKVSASIASNFAFRWVIEALHSKDQLGIESAAFHCAVVLGPHRWQHPPRLSGVSARTRKIRAVCTSILDRLEENLSLSLLAGEAGMSPFYFARVFSELVGEPPHRYLVRARLQNAARLLRAGAPVTQAAVKSGFADVNHFSKTFHRRYGVAPSRYASSS
jgi:AraC-like DNA-binding protein